MRCTSAAALAASVAALLASPAAAAVYRDQVGQIDFHHALVGLPQDDAAGRATFFHRPRLDDKASLLYSLTDAAGGVLAAVNPSNGALLWRQMLGEDGDDDDDDDEIASHVVALSEALVSGRGGAVHAWNAVSGRALWRADLTGTVAGLAAASDDDVLVASVQGEQKQGTVLRRLAGSDGHVLWEALDRHVRPLHVAVSGNEIFVVGVVVVVQAGGSSSSLKAVVFDAESGHRLTEHTLSGRDTHVLFVGNGGADPARVAPVVVWTDAGRTKLRVQALGSSRLGKQQEFGLPPNTLQVLVHAVRQPIASKPLLPLHFVVHARLADGTHSAQVLHVDAATHAVTLAYTFPVAPGVGAFAVSPSDDNNNNDDDSRLYVTRITDDEVVLTASTAADEVLGRWPLVSTKSAVSPRVPRLSAAGAAAAEVAAKTGASGTATYAVRAAVVTADDDWTLVRNGLAFWSRPEGLAGAVAAVLVDRPAGAAQQLVRALEQEAHSSSLLAAYVHRVRRHVEALKRLPDYLQGLPGRVMASVVGGKTTTTTTTTTTDDPFGFHKLAILATRRGRLYGLDAASPGAVQWTTKVPLPQTVSGAWAVQRIHVDEAAGVALVVGATVRESVVVQIATGEVISSDNIPAFAAAFFAIDPDAPLASTTWVTGADGARWVLPVVQTEDKKEVVPADVLTLSNCPKESIVVRSAAAGGGGLEGVRFVSGGERCAAHPTWSFHPPAGFRIATVAARAAHEPVASMGRVLADRRVLYKYLNANVAVVAALNDKDAALLTVLLDTVSGQVLATATHGGVDGRKPVDCLVVENSFACTFFGDGGVGGSGGVKGYQLALSDLYESATPNEHLVSGVNVSAVQPIDAGNTVPIPAVFAQTWVLPTRLTALAVTQTRQGISVRELLAYAPRRHGILALPRVGGVLDARRPVGRDVTAGEAVEEGLTRYTPQLAPQLDSSLDGRVVLSHGRDVAGVRGVVTAATHVESTSLVLAYGALDVFGTRATPSGAFDLLDAGFNKVSMLGTVLALAVGVALLRPLVAKKQIALRWGVPA